MENYDESSGKRQCRFPEGLEGAFIPRGAFQLSREAREEMRRRDRLEEEAKKAVIHCRKYF